MSLENRRKTYTSKHAAVLGLLKKMVYQLQSEG